MGRPTKKLTIIGGGIAAALEAYYTYLEAKQNGTQVRITIYEKNHALSDTTAYNIMPSLTPDEILSVVPRGKDLPEKLGILFSEPGGIRVEDVPGVNQSIIAQRFLEQAKLYSQDENGHLSRTQTLLKLGKISMDLWQKMYEDADPEFRQILKSSNFQPCREPHNIESKQLHDGYRIDLIYNVENAKDKALGMINDYQSIGYSNCSILSPAEVEKRDPVLAHFCATYSDRDPFGDRQWHNDTVALYRPGGCIDAELFLPQLYDYLKKKMGQYVNENGELKDCFHLKFDRPVVGVEYDASSLQKTIDALHFSNGMVKHNKHHFENSHYMFAPGEKVGTLDKLGLSEPAYSGFAGASLRFNIPLPPEKRERYKNFNHCMEVHKVGVVLAWQARCIGNAISIGVAGTKAFYADKTPSVDEDFAKNRNLLQLNIVNDILPELIGEAIGRDTKGQTLNQDDLNQLEAENKVRRRVKVRGVAYDGFPTLGSGHDAQGNEISNATITTHLGSGGVSFGPAAVTFSRSVRNQQKDQEPEPFVKEVLNYASCLRKLGV